MLPQSCLPRMKTQRLLSSLFRNMPAVQAFAKSTHCAEDNWHNWEHKKGIDGNSRRCDTFPV